MATREKNGNAYANVGNTNGNTNDLIIAPYMRILEQCNTMNRKINGHTNGQLKTISTGSHDDGYTNYNQTLST